MTEPNPARRRFFAQAAGVAAALAYPKASAEVAGTPIGAGLTDTSASPHVRVRSVGLREVRWTRGFWAERFAVCRDATIPHLWEVMRGTEPSQFLHNFRVAAGLAEGAHRGPAWNDGDFYKWIETASAVLAVSDDRALDQQLDDAIAVIARAQRDDGYLHTPVLIRNRQGERVPPFQDRLGFESYNLGHLMTAACVHQRATGKASLLDIAIKAADFLDAASRSPAPSLARCAVCPAHYMGVIELYRLTREPRYRALALRLIDLRDRVEDGTDDNQDRIPFRKQTQAVGHAVRANYLYAGAADVYAEEGDPALLAPLLKVWEDVVLRKMYINGACGALYDGASPDGAKDQKTIGRTHQAYGRAYQLPNSTAHNETCAAIGNVLWNWRMLQITGEARFADVLELALYNAVLAGVSLDGMRFFYTNTLRQLDPMPADLRWSRRREGFISCFCCPPNVARTVAEASGYAYSRSTDAVWVHLYGGSTLDTTVESGRLALTQETDYPWDGRVTLTLTAAPSRPVALRLRIPGWASGSEVSLNGKAVSGRPEAGSYFEVRRTWVPGDVLTLSLPMRVRLMEAHPLVEEARRQVAVQRGPIVYCLESTDLPAGVRVQEVTVPRGIVLEPRFDRDRLGGACVLEGRAEARPEGDWSRSLYRELSHAPAAPIDLRLIPYYAWGNRGSSEMTIWMPLGG